MKLTTQQKIDIYRNFFTGREDVYGTYDLATGKVRQVKDQVTNRVILDHLLGRQPYGVYLLVDDRIGSVVADFDDHDPNPPLDFVHRAQHHGIPSYIERSKSKGYHVWIFFESSNVLALKARLVVRSILQEMNLPGTEVFPKQDRLCNRTSYGNFINAPLFGELVPVGKTIFVEPTLTMQAYNDQWDFLENIVSRVPESTLDEVIEVNELSKCPAPVESATNDNQRSKHIDLGFGLPPCARKMLSEGVAQNQRVSCFRLAVHFNRIGVPEEIAIEALKKWASKNQPRNGNPIIKPSEIISQTISGYRGYKGCGCEDSAVTPFCDTGCPLYKINAGIPEQ